MSRTAFDRSRKLEVRRLTSVASAIAIPVVTLVVTLFAAGCMSVLTNTAVLSDSSHLGTPYSGARANLHTLYCFGREASRDPTALLLTPLIIFPLVDLPMSTALDTLLLPLDIAIEPERPPLQIGGGGCRLVGM